MKKALIVIVAVLGLGAMVFASMRQGSSTGKGAKVDLEAAETRGITQVVKASGQIDPRVKVNLSSHVIGKIERLYVEEGDEVTAGQPVLELEKEAFLAVRNRMTAQLQIARTQLRQAEIDLRDAELRHKRYARLLEEGVVPAEKLESVALERDSGELRREQAEEEIRRVEADLEKARDDLEKATIYAPLTGRVIELNAEEGEVVVSGTMNNPASVIGTIADLSEILTEVDVDETEIVDVRLGQKATIEVDAIPDDAYHGEVVEVGSSGYSLPSQRDVTFFKVKVLLADADERLRPGMSARAEIEVATREDALLVPIQAVVFREPVSRESSAQASPAASPEELEADSDLPAPPRGGRGDEDEEVEVVFVFNEGKAVQRVVETGLADDTNVEIRAGLEDGDRVVVGPYRELKKLDDGEDIQERGGDDDEDSGEDDEEDDDEEGS